MKMLICSIGSKNRESTLHFAAKVAKALSADTHLLGVVHKERRVANLKQFLDNVAQTLIEQGLLAQTRVEVGRDEDVIMAETEGTEYDLVAAGALGDKRSRRALLNTVGMRIVERAQSSVLLIKGNRPSLSRVLVCFSGTKHGHLSVWTGAALACGAGAEATLLHVVDALPAMYTGLEQMEETLAELLQSDTDMSRELKWAAQVLHAECSFAEVKLRRGIVADEILGEGQDGNHDVIVLGSSQSAGGIVRALMGDLCREVVTRAQRPVLVVRP
jgi:nucleotide-binding universal stress UspA family protein